MGSEIRRWQRSVVRDANSEGSSSKQDGFARRLSRAACELFHLFLEQGRLETTRPHRRALRRVYSHLQLWCDGYSVLSGDLDAVLSESTGLRRDTYRLLVSICHTLANKIAIPLSTNPDDWQCGLYKEAARTRDLIEEVTFANEADDGTDSASDYGSDTSSVTNDFDIEEIIKDLETDISCLIDLGPRYKEPIRDRTVKEQPALLSPAVNWDPAEHLASRIRHRYPNGDAAFAHILGQLNWQRAKRLYAAREANARASERPAIKLAAASRAKGTVVASDFHDSGLGTTLASPTSYAETVLSYRGTKGGSISVPQVPPEGTKGEPFICEICGCTCQLPEANWKSSWKRHVFSDLEPYVCVMAECQFSQVPFPNKTTWVQHLKLEHDSPGASKQIACPLCQERIGTGGISHLARHLEEVSLTILPTNTESDDESEGNTEQALNEEPDIPYETLTKHPVNSTPSEPSSEVLNVGEPGEKPDESAWSQAVALYNLKPARTSELPLVKGQKLWILQSAEKSPGAVWIPALCDQGQRQGWVPRSYARLVGNGSAAEGGGVGPEPSRPNPEFEFQTRLAESSQATLPSTFPPLVPLGEPWANTGTDKLEGAVADQSRKTGEAGEGEAASLSHPLDPLEGLKKGGIDENPGNGDFVLFEGDRDDLVYFPPLLKNTEELHGDSRELLEKDAAYYKDKVRGAPLQTPKSRGGKNRRDYPSSWGLDKGQMTMKKRVMAVFDGEQPTGGFPSLSFSCPQPGCRTAFTHKDDLERHKRKHWPGEGRLLCIEPGYATTWSTEEHLGQHQAETHANPQVHTEARPDDPKGRPVGSKGRGSLDSGLQSGHPSKSRITSLYGE